MRYCVLSLVFAVLAVGCGPGSGPQVIEETRTGPSPAADASATTADRFGMNRATAAASTGGGDEVQTQLFQWDMPEGWSELAMSGLRFVNLAVGNDYSDHGTECYVTILQGDGGGVDANVNRWRAQLGLEPMTPEEIVALPTLPFLSRDALYLDAEGTYTGMQGSANIEDARMLAAIFVAQGRAVTIKMVGPAAVVDREKANFEQVVTSLRPAEQPPAPADSAAAANSEFTWTTPEGWVAGPENQMRIATYLTGPDNGVEISVLSFPGDTGGIDANVNRWRGQVGVGPLDSAAIAALPTLTILGTPSPLVEAEGTYTGMGDANVSGAMLIGAICPLGERSLFLKMTGPADAVKAEREKFVAFCESFQQ